MATRSPVWKHPVHGRAPPYPPATGGGGARHRHAQVRGWRGLDGRVNPALSVHPLVGASTHLAAPPAPCRPPQPPPALHAEGLGSILLPAAGDGGCSGDSLGTPPAGRLRSQKDARGLELSQQLQQRRGTKQPGVPPPFHLHGPPGSSTPCTRRGEDQQICALTQGAPGGSEQSSRWTWAPGQQLPPHAGLTLSLAALSLGGAPRARGAWAGVGTGFLWAVCARRGRGTRVACSG